MEAAVESVLPANLITWVAIFLVILSLIFHHNDLSLRTYGLVLALPLLTLWGLLERLIFLIPFFSQTIPAPKFLPKGQVKRVCVIGAGPSGITAAKECLDEGLEVEVFEMTDAIGGNWVFRERDQHSSVYKSTFINTTKQLMAYSDFPMPDSFPTYPHHQQIVKYFNDYADTFDVTPHIHFSTKVENVELVEGQRWRVTHCKVSQDGTAPCSDSIVEEFDGVMVCTGHHSKPKWPTPSFEGQDSFKGHMMHSHSYKDPTTGYNFHDKRVLVVGIGNSGVDIANELSRCAKQVYLSTRSGAWIIPKLVQGIPIDHLVGFLQPRLLFNLLPSWWPESKYAFSLLEDIVTKQQGEMKHWGLDPHMSLGGLHPTISQELLHRVSNGTVIIKPQLSSIKPNSVVFSDESDVEMDAIIFCTGYHITFPFLKGLVSIEKNQAPLYKYVFPPELPPTIAVVGLIQPTGAIMPISEMHSRWIVQVFKGKCGLPTKEDMYKDIKHKREKLAKRYKQSERHTIQVDFLLYMDEIASLFDATPNMWSATGVMREYLVGPIWPPQYRLRGPHAKPEIAKEAMKVSYNQTKTEVPGRRGAGSLWMDNVNRGKA